MKGLILFVALPYVALVSVVLGSIFRYRNHGFSVSSLSSQLLENRLLFFGSRPFHWGIIFLFFGHLTAFLIPGAVLAWNGVPARLYILEVTAFAFGITVLLSLLLLIYRRLSISRIRVVTSRMDVYVYVILLIQAATGLWIAFFFRWGSSWFAEILAPYLHSVLIFRPDIAAVVALPVIVKIHIASAFVFIGMIPYTRFMHFLVYPFTYIWRKYQLVIWNSGKRSGS